MRTRIISLFFLLSCLGCSTKKNEIPVENDTWSFIVFSDVQQGYGIYRELANNISRIKPTPIAAFCCGDLMLRPGNEAEWLNFIRFSKPVTDKMPLYIARGNHEGNSAACEEVLRAMGYFPGAGFYYSVRKKECLFIVSDTREKGYEDAIAGEQYDWLRAELDSSDALEDIQHVFLFMHQPLFPQGMHRGGPLKNAEELHNLFRGYPKIRAVFAGHDHIFNRFRKNEINYITTGGGGGDLHHGYGGDYHHITKVTFYNESERFNLKTIGIFNEVIEDFDL